MSKKCLKGRICEILVSRKFSVVQYLIFWGKMSPLNETIVTSPIPLEVISAPLYNTPSGNTKSNSATLSHSIAVSDVPSLGAHE